MMLVDEALQSLLQYVGVNFGCRNVCMPKKLLYGAKVGTTVKQVAGEGVAQDVRADAFGIEPSFHAQLFDILSESLARQVPIGACGWK